MSEFNLPDEELNDLLKERLLSGKDDTLADMQSKIVFAGKAKVLPPLAKEKALFSKLGIKAGAKTSLSWIFTWLSTLAVVTATTVVLVMNSAEKKTEHSLATTTQPASNKELALAPADSTQAGDHSTETRNITVTPTLTTVKSIPTMGNVESAEPVSTKTVVPASNISAASISETKTATPSTPNATMNGNEDVFNAKPVLACKKPVSSCRIWKTKDLCGSIDSLKFPYGIECNNCEYSLDCKEYNSKKLTAVVLRVYKKSGFTLEKNFQNIHLTRANGKKYNPVAISVDRFMSGVSKARVNFKNVVDIILLFPEAGPGDKVSIEGVVEAMIEE